MLIGSFVYMAFGILIGIGISFIVIGLFLNKSNSLGSKDDNPKGVTIKIRHLSQKIKYKDKKLRHNPEARAKKYIEDYLNSINSKK